MLSYYGINDEDVLKVIVVSTMSSGKSTLINSLVGSELLPSKNEACTAKGLYILNNKEKQQFTAYTINKSGEKEILDIHNNEIINSINENGEVTEVLLEGNIEYINNIGKPIVLIDTPGTNFSLDNSHKLATYNVVEESSDGLILYVINATQFGINDDFVLLQHCIKKVKASYGKLGIVFIVNKIDELDCEKEELDQLISNVKEYIEDLGINNPEIISISALGSKLFNDVLNGKNFTRKENRDFNRLYDLFKCDDFNLSKYSFVDYKNNKEKCRLGSENLSENNVEYSKKDLSLAIVNTGIKELARYIETFFIDRLAKGNIKINFNKNSLEFSTSNIFIISEDKKIKDNLKLLIDKEKNKKIANLEKKKINFIDKDICENISDKESNLYIYIVNHISPVINKDKLDTIINNLKKNSKSKIIFLLDGLNNSCIDSTEKQNILNKLLIEINHKGIERPIVIATSINMAKALKADELQVTLSKLESFYLSEYLNKVNKKDLEVDFYRNISGEVLQKLNSDIIKAINEESTYKVGIIYSGITILESFITNFIET